MSCVRFTFNDQAQQYIDRLNVDRSNGLQVIQNNLGTLFQSSRHSDQRMEDNVDENQEEEWNENDKAIMCI